MFAIVEDGNRQYRVAVGDKLVIDLREAVNPGDAISFDRVLLAGNGTASQIGRPLIAGATVSARVVEPLLKGEKLEIQKFRRRHNVRRHTGHRQKHTVVEILAINVSGL